MRTNREEFFRLKKVQGKKKRNQELADNEKRAAQMRGEKVDSGHGDDSGGGGGGGSADLLNDDKDNDVIF